MMSFNEEIKPNINSIENNLNFNLKIKTEDSTSVSQNRQFFETKPRLLAPSKLSFNKCNENPNRSIVLSTPSSKRFSDEGEDSEKLDKELSPLFKRIKKEYNNCLLFDSKQFIKQELDTELDFNSRQPFVGLFSKLSLDRTCIPAPESSNSYPLSATSCVSEANDLSEVLKQLNICHKSNQNCDQKTTSSSLNSKIKKKKNKKSKKSREKLKVTKNVFKTIYNSKSKVKSLSLSHKKEAKTQCLFKIQSTVIKELKVNACGGLTADEIQTLLTLKNEGVVRKNRKHCLLLKCLLCNNRHYDWKSAEEHIRSSSHLRNKSEQRFSKLDSILLLDLGQSQDIEKLLSRRRLLSQLSNKTKEVLHSKGIRVKDGYGSQSFICIDCHNESFGSLEAVFDHINTKSRLIDGLNHISLGSGPNTSDNIGDVLLTEGSATKKMFEDLTLDQLNNVFDGEGIIKRVHKRSKSKKLKYYCNLCQKYRNTDYEMFKHINDLCHLSAKTRNNIKNQMNS